MPAIDENTTGPAEATRTDTATATAPAGHAPRRSARGLWIAGLLTALFLAGGVSFYASAHPDGLERVAADFGIDRTARDHAAADSPFADYSTANVEDERISGGLAGVIGVGATLAVGTGVFWVLRRRTSSSAGAEG